MQCSKMVKKHLKNRVKSATIFSSMSDQLGTIGIRVCP